MQIPQSSDGATTRGLQELLARLKEGGNIDGVKRQLVACCLARLQLLARRVLAGYDRNALDEETNAIVAEAYIRLNRSLDELRPETVRELFGLAALQMRRYLLDRLRTLRGRGAEPRPRVNSMSLAASDPSLSTVEPADDAARAAWTTMDVMEALDKLEERERECLVLQHWYGLSHQEIAGMLGVSTKTVQRAGNLAILQLQELLKGYGTQS